MFFPDNVIPQGGVMPIDIAEMVHVAAHFQATASQTMLGIPNDQPFLHPEFAKIVNVVHAPSLLPPPSYRPMIGEPIDIPLPPDPR